MRRFQFAAFAAVAVVGFASVASAAPPTPTFTWTGFYVGANAGYSWGPTKVGYSQGPASLIGATFANPPFVLGGGLPFSMEPKGFLGGLQLGYNYQTGIWVWGIEADYAWRNREQTLGINMNGFSDTLTLTDKQNSVGTVRGRIGVTQGAANNWLIYLTGGLAYSKFDHSVTQFCNLFCPPQTRTFSDSTTKAGWTLGGGVEVALDRNWSVGAEYLYMAFGRDTLNAAQSGVFPATAVTFHDHSNVVRFKVNYKFGML